MVSLPVAHLTQLRFTNSTYEAADSPANQSVAAVARLRSATAPEQSLHPIVQRRRSSPVQAKGGSRLGSKLHHDFVGNPQHTQDFQLRIEEHGYEAVETKLRIAEIEGGRTGQIRNDPRLYLVGLALASLASTPFSTELSLSSKLSRRATNHSA